MLSHMKCKQKKSADEISSSRTAKKQTLESLFLNSPPRQHEHALCVCLRSAPMTSINRFHELDFESYEEFEV